MRREVRQLKSTLLDGSNRFPESIWHQPLVFAPQRLRQGPLDVHCRRSRQNRRQLRLIVRKQLANFCQCRLCVVAKEPNRFRVAERDPCLQ